MLDTQPRCQHPLPPDSGTWTYVPACIRLSVAVKAGSRSQTKMLLAGAVTWLPWPLGPLTLPPEFGTRPQPWPPKPHSCWTTPSRNIDAPKPCMPSSLHLLFPECRDFFARLTGVTQHHSPQNRPGAAGRAQEMSCDDRYGFWNSFPHLTWHNFCAWQVSVWSS